MFDYFFFVNIYQWWIQDFPEGGAPTPKVGVLTYYFAIFFAKNCMKMKECGPQGARVPGAPLKVYSHREITSPTFRKSWICQDQRAARQRK